MKERRWAVLGGMVFLAVSVWIFIGFAGFFSYVGLVRNEMQSAQALKKNCAERFPKAAEHFYCLREAEAMGQIDLKTTIARTLIMGEGMGVLRNQSGPGGVQGPPFALAYYDWIIYGAEWALRSKPPVVAERIFRKIYLKTLVKQLDAFPATADEIISKDATDKEKKEYAELKKRHARISDQLDHMLDLSWFEVIVKGLLERMGGKS